jgi:[histone H3]-trimethyl-L-lysine4 demethylase
MFCLDPPLTSVPKDQWFCHTCLFGTGGDFGFDEGEEHSLSSFQARDLEFRRMWFEKHPPQNTPPGAITIKPDASPPPGADVNMADEPQVFSDDPTVNKIGNVLVSETDIEEEFWRLVASPHETVEVEYGADVHSTTHGR